MAHSCGHTTDCYVVVQHVKAESFVSFGFFSKNRLAFIREPVVFNKTIIPVARRALVGSALPQRALQAILRNNLV